MNGIGVTRNKRKNNWLNRYDWVAGALELLALSGVENLKTAPTYDKHLTIQFLTIKYWCNQICKDIR